MDTQHDFGPIQELRFAFGSKSALTVGAAMGGAAPIANYFTVHLGKLVEFNEDTQTFKYATWDNPLWLMAAGTFALSCKSVYQWGCNAYENDCLKACGLVAMLEGALILAPHWAIGVGALAFLVLINMAAGAAALGRRDLRDKAVVEGRQAPEPTVDTADLPSIPPSTAVSTQLLPAPVLHLVELPTPALPVSRVDDPGCDPRQYDQAEAYTLGLPAVSAAKLRKKFGHSHAVAVGLIDELAARGVISSTTNSLGQRPVLAG